MAGSNKWFNYQSDDGTDWCLFGDESNIEGANGGSAVPPGTGTQYKIPRNMRVRYAVFANQAGTRSLTIPITTQAVYIALDASNAIPDGLPGSTGTLAFIRKRPELIGPVPTVFDTGLDDGDQP